MEAMSTANITDNTLMTAFGSNVDNSFSRSVIQRVVSETEKGQNNSANKKASVEKEAERAASQAEVRDAELPEQMSPEEQYIEEQQNYSQQDLNDYYSKLASSNYIPSDYNSQDPIAAATEGVKSSATSLSQAMITAMQKGMSIEDAYNIRSAKAAYEANVRSLKSTIEVKI